MKSIRWIAVVLVVITAGCGGKSMEWKGTLKGTYELMDHKAATSSTYPPAAPLDTASGSATLEAAGHDLQLTLDSGSPIPGCMITFYPGSAKRDNTGKATAMEYRMKQSSTIKRSGGAEGCVGRIDKGGSLMEIEIIHAQVALYSDGQFYVSIDYSAKGDYDKERILRTEGTRGWF